MMVTIIEMTEERVPVWPPHRNDNFPEDGLGETSQRALEESEPGRVRKTLFCLCSLQVILPHTDKNVLEG